MDQYIGQVVDTVHRTGGQVRGPIPLPSKITHFTTNRSPHVDKKSREQFKRVIHKRVLYIPDPSDQTVQALQKLDEVAEVRVKMKEADGVKLSLPEAAE